MSASKIPWDAVDQPREEVMIRNVLSGVFLVAHASFTSIWNGDASYDQTFC